jgi:putative membrane protein
MWFTANIVVFIVGVLHLWFMALEMYFWTQPLGHKVFGQSPAQAASSKTLAANQGLYNGFLSAGLFWGLLCGEPLEALHFKLFFLACVVLAGAYGAYTVNKKILFVQALPAALGLILFVLSSTIR